jgi:hypothetical protein
METNTTPPEQSTPEQPAPAPRRKRWPFYAAIGFFVLVILGGVGFVTASVLEDHDSFCITCHTVPETTYYNRAYMSLDNPAGTVPDLASAHYQLSKIHNKPDFGCINCHHGDGSLVQRVSTIALGGRDMLIFISGRENPAIEKTVIAEGFLPNASCTACHADTLLRLQGIDNHFHNYLPQAKEALAKGGQISVDPSITGDRRDRLLKRGMDTTIDTPLVCTDCHVAHKTIPNGATNFFMEADRRNKACVSCHITANQGPQTTDGLGE